VRRGLAVVLFAAVATAGCSGSSSAPKFPTIAAARTFELAHFRPARAARAGTPATVSFVIKQPNGKPLTTFRRGGGPHTGVHLILVRNDLAYIVHRHPPIAADGTIRDRIAFPAPGTYRAVVDTYPKTTGPLRNFQLFHTIKVAGPYRAQKLPPFTPVQAVDGYKFAIEGAPRLRAIQAAFLKIRVTAPDGKPARFTPWYGALAHAIFFRRGSLDYFHTHVCAPGTAGCTSAFGGSRVTGSSTEPGKLTVGVLVPAPGTWRLFLQTRANGRVLTAPFTLVVH
jgi:hypothetical protein